MTVTTSVVKGGDNDRSTKAKRAQNVVKKSESHWFLALAQGSHHWSLEQFQEFGLRLLKTRVAFDSAMWGRAASVPNLIVDVHLHRQPQAMIDDYLARYQQHDFFALQVMTHPGKAILLSDLVTREQLQESPIFEHAERWKMRHIACVGRFDAETGLFEMISLWRESPTKPFSEKDRANLQTLAPHLFVARKINRLQSMSRAGSSLRDGKLALTNDSGILFEAETGFLDFIRTEWPDFAGSELPGILYGALRQHGHFEGCRLSVSGKHLESGMWLLQAMQHHQTGQLSPQEATVARLYAAGETHPAIAAQLGVTSNTVRTVISRIYKKLGVSSKVALSRALEKLNDTK